MIRAEDKNSTTSPRYRRSKTSPQITKVLTQQNRCTRTHNKLNNTCYHGHQANAHTLARIAVNKNLAQEKVHRHCIKNVHMRSIHNLFTRIFQEYTYNILAKEKHTGSSKKTKAKAQH